MVERERHPPCRSRVSVSVNAVIDQEDVIPNTSVFIKVVSKAISATYYRPLRDNDGRGRRKAVGAAVEWVGLTTD